jgi:hypothetical protein
VREVRIGLLCCGRSGLLFGSKRYELHQQAPIRGACHTGGGFSFFCMVIMPIRFFLFTGASSLPFPVEVNQ